MKIPGRFGKNRLRSILFLFPVLLVLLLIGSGVAWSSSHESGHEQAGTAAHSMESSEGHAVEGGEGHGEAGAEGESHGGGIHWQKTDGYRVFNFAILAIGLFLLLRKPMSQALRNRIKGIQTELESLENRKAEVEKQLADYNAKLSELDKESEQIVADYIRQGEEAKVRILKEAQSAADKLKEQAQKNIAYEFEQAKLTLQAEIVEKALAKAETLIRDQISDKDQNRLVDEYLEKVGG
jgi:F-type H+-transporting ATPase subunit b